MAVAIQELVVIGLYKALTLLGVVLGLTITWHVVNIVYNLFFHPLRNFPGPLLQRASPLPWASQLVRGRLPFETQKLHDEYGTVVRIAPNHLSFTDAAAWKDIYGHLVGHKSGQQELSKTQPFSGTIDDIPTSIIDSDREEHGRIRRALSHGFSDSSMRQQAPIVTKYVDLLLSRLHQQCADGSRPLNAEEWYNWTTFDITGDLIFGQTFGCLSDSAYHPWIEFIFGAVKYGAFTIAMSYLGFHSVVQWIYRRASGAMAIKKMQEYNFAMVGNRLAMKEAREDLFEGLVKKREEWGLSFEKLSSNAFILVLAGSETTATALSGVTYLLTTHPDVLEKLNREVRGAFGSVDEIDVNSVNKLTYMLAVLNEALRMFPPVTSNLVRKVPKGGVQIAGHYIPGGTYVEIQQWSMNHSKENWVDPWEFRPERFLNQNTKPGERGNVLEALQAFSMGPRNCIGRNLAYAEMRLILARIIYDFDMKLAEDSKNWIERQKAYTLWERIPLNVYFTPVQRG